MKRRFLSLAMALVMLIGLVPVAAAAEESKGTASNPYTLEEFNALTKPVDGTVYVTLGTINMADNDNSITIGNDNLVDNYVHQLPTKAGTFNEDGSFTITDESSYIVAPVDQYLLADTAADTGTNYSYVKSNVYGSPTRIGYYTSEKPYKKHLNLIIVGGIINGNTQQVGDINSNNDISTINVKVQDDADVTFQGVTINGCYNFYLGHKQGLNSSECLHTLQSLTFEKCIFNGVWLQNGGNNAKQTVFRNCTFTDYNNGNNSNPIWIQNMNRMQSVTITGCNVTSTRPIKFEGSVYDANITITNNTFTMFAGETHTNNNSNSNAALMFGTNSSSQFNNITISDNVLVTDPGVHQQLIALYGGTIAMDADAKMALSNNLDGKGNLISGTELIDEWKAEGKNQDVLKTYVQSYVPDYVKTTTTITDSNGFVYQYASLQDAVDAAEDGDTVAVLSADAGDATVSGEKTFKVSYDASIPADSKPTISAGSGYQLSTGADGTITVTPSGNGGQIPPVIGSLLPIWGSQLQSPFVDVSTVDYYYDAVNWAVDNGITTGTGRYSFSPDEACTRAQAVTFLWRAAGSPAPKSAATPFVDVDSNAYYYKAVLWAVENGITVGTSATTFSPADTCTRAQIVTFLYRAFGRVTSASATFTDVAADAYYAPAVAWAAANSITGGTGSGRFSPAATCTRAQIVTFLYRCCG